VDRAQILVALKRTTAGTPPASAKSIGALPLAIAGPECALLAQAARRQLPSHVA